MKALLLSLLLLTTPVLAWDEQHLSPTDVLRADRTLVLTDGSSYFLFSRDGKFRSFPVDGMNGRTFDGRWSTFGEGPAIFTVKATEGWINGASPIIPDNYRIVFAVYRGHTRAAAHVQWHGGGDPPSKVWDGYYMIQELIKVSKGEEAPR